MDSDDHLRAELEQLRAIHSAETVIEEAAAAIQQESQEQDAASTERAIIDGARVLRDRMIDIQDKRLRVNQASRLGRWLMTRRSIPEIRFGFDGGNEWDSGDMTVATAPLMTTEEETTDGKVTYGWVFELESPVPEVMLHRGFDDPPIHAYGNYKTSSIDIYRVAEDEATGLQTKEKWFTINPDSDSISCWKLAEQRGPSYMKPMSEEDRRDEENFNEEIRQASLNFDVQRASEAIQRYQPRAQRISQQLDEQFSPDQETGLQLLGLIRGSLSELR